MSEAQLEILASRAGLAVDWVDANGTPQHVPAHALRAVLAGLGLPADTAEAIETSLLNLQLEQQNKHLPPLLTADVGKSLNLARYFNPHSQCVIHLETGGTLDIQLDADAWLPGMIGVGYHRAQVEDQHFILAVAPARCYSMADAVNSATPRAWGLSTQLYALKRQGDGGLATPGPWRTLPRPPASVAPMPWRSARCTPCSAATRIATAPTRPPAGCFSTACTPPPPLYWVRSRCNGPSRPAVLPRTAPAGATAAD